MSLDLAAQIWNRACLDGGGPSPREGDRALSAMLLAHGFVMNGGVQHAVEVLEPSELAAACEAFEYYDLGAAAAVLQRAALERLPDDAPIEEHEALEEGLNAAYWSVAADDQLLDHAFRRHLRSRPDAYAPTVENH